MAEKKKVLTEEEKAAAKAAAEAEVDALVKKGLKALDEFADFTQEKIDNIVAKMSVAGLDHHGDLARLAIDETGRGVFEDKATKNLFACEYVVNNMRHLKTVGIISDDPVTGITEIAEPVGVICGVTPVTNPTSTVIFKSLISIKTRNPIIFGFHPGAQKCSAAAAKVMLDAAIAAGAPKNCIQWIEHPSIDATSALMKHPGVSTILATGGPGMVKAAYTSGKPALGVGAGNVPCYINETADIRRAVNDVVLSKSFDNGMICASESAVFIDEKIFDETIRLFKEYRVYFASEEEKRKLEAYMFGVTRGSGKEEEAKAPRRRRRHVRDEHRQERGLLRARRHPNHRRLLRRSRRQGADEPRKALPDPRRLQGQRREGRLREVRGDARIRRPRT